MLRTISRILTTLRRSAKLREGTAADQQPAGLSARILRIVRSDQVRQIAARLDPRALLRRRRRPPPIVRPYVDFRRPLRRFGRLIFPIWLGFFCLVYGFFFALTAPYLVLPFSVPIVILVLLSIWALPDVPHAPTKTMEFCFMVVLVSRILWPNYLALQLPGMPWITILRLAGFPMAFLLLICLSTSAPFRAESNQVLRSVPGTMFCLVGLTLMGFITIPLSAHPASSFQLGLLSLVYMVAIIVIAAWIGRIPKRVSRYVYLFLLISVPIMAMTILESRVHKVLWIDNIPSFLKVNDPAVIRTLTQTTRGSTGAYRAKATFSTSLGLSEFLAILTPFFLHIAVKPYNVVVRLMAIVALPISFYCIRATDARLGVVGFLVSFLVYIFIWGISRFQRKRSDLFGAAVVYGYPAFAMLAGAAVLFVHRIKIIVLGGGEDASSNAARQDQITTGIPKIISNPIGHGLGEAGNALGFVTGDFITVDNYYLTTALETGIFGLVVFLLLFLIPVIYAVILVLRHPRIVDDRELSLIIPLSVSISAFLVIKLVFSQADSHMLLFALLGMQIALAYRIRKIAAEQAAAAEKAAQQAPPPAKFAARQRLPAPRASAAAMTRGLRTP